MSVVLWRQLPSDQRALILVWQGMIFFPLNVLFLYKIEINHKSLFILKENIDISVKFFFSKNENMFLLLFARDADLKKKMQEAILSNSSRAFFKNTYSQNLKRQ